MLTVYGIETKRNNDTVHDFIPCVLQQCLPFTVLKHDLEYLNIILVFLSELQQCLPFTVLKRQNINPFGHIAVATVLTVYGIETRRIHSFISKK